jgi:hypothetical protein
MPAPVVAEAPELPEVPFAVRLLKIVDLFPEKEVPEPMVIA